VAGRHTLGGLKRGGRAGEGKDVRTDMCELSQENTVLAAITADEHGRGRKNKKLTAHVGPESRVVLRRSGYDRVSTAERK